VGAQEKGEELGGVQWWDREQWGFLNKNKARVKTNYFLKSQTGGKRNHGGGGAGRAP